MYAVVLSYHWRPELRMISEAHCFVMKTMLAALGDLAPDARFMGTSDLAVKGRKFSGNSLRAKRSHLLYHGTLLYEFPLDLISACLRSPPRQPDYRSGRTHADFVANLGVPPEGLRRAIIEHWQAYPSSGNWPEEKTDELVRQRYSRDDWNQRL
jgi:lipoate-protein ligase A